MLEEIVRAVSVARASFLLKQLRAEREWNERAERALRPVRSAQGIRAVVFESQKQPVFFSYGTRLGEQAIVTYHSPHEEQTLTYIVGRARRYAANKLDAFYVHVPSWASIQLVSQHELGEGVLGTANTSSGEIRLLHSLNPAERTEVLLHETLHLLYPWHPEKEIRNLTRSIMGAQYCHFH